MASFMVHEVVEMGSHERRGQGKLDSLLKEGWQIMDVDDSEKWEYDDENYGKGVQCCVYKYKLRKD
ncbi:MAG: hypothetical protein M0P74_17930 [Syntrophales bacterium]|jgi:hypothetical protein|nr:hypothetical protein [Syntrophales bacterium]